MFEGMFLFALACALVDVADLSSCFAERTERTAVRDGCADVLSALEVLLGADV